MAPFKAGFVAIAGRPSVGKSTLMNALLGRKLSIVSPRPQTTRHKLLGILDGEGHQVCFLDTPGMIERPKDRLQEALRRAARAAVREDADVIVWLVEPRPPGPEEVQGLLALKAPEVPVILALNKADLVPSAEKAAEALRPYEEALKPAASVRVSALKGAGVPELLREILARLPESEAYYERGQLSDRWERFFAAELIREQVFALYEDEVPHATAVAIEEFKEGPRADRIRANLYVERDGQKGILIGEKGRALRALSEASRKTLEAFLERPVELELWVKVRAGWRGDQRSLKEFGYLP